MDRKQIFTVPNFLSFLRILLVPFIAISYLRAEVYLDYIVTGLLILLSGLTDCIDGFVARKYNSITDLGKILDPFADKLTQTVLAVCIAIRIPEMIILLSIFVVKEVLMGVGGLVLLKKGVKIEGAKWFGKLATVVFYLTMLLVLLIPQPGHGVLYGLIGTSAAFMIFSFVMYIPEFFKLKRTEEVHE